MVINEIRGNEIGTDEAYGNLCDRECAVDLFFPIRSGRDPRVVPGNDGHFPQVRFQVELEGVQPFLVLVAIANKNLVAQDSKTSRVDKPMRG